MILAIVTSYFFMFAAAQFTKPRVIQSGAEINITEEAGANLILCPKNGCHAASIKLPHPFFTGFANSPKFIAVSFIRTLDRQKHEELLYEYVRPAVTSLYPANVDRYGFWGIEITDLTWKDSGIYEAFHVSTAITLNKKVRLTVVDDEAPVCH